MAEKVIVQLEGQTIELTKEKVIQLCLSGNDKDLSDEDYARYANLCKQHKLNPFTREAYIIQTDYNGNKKCQVMIGKEGYFKMADANPNYDGMRDGVIVITPDKHIQELEGCFVPPGWQLAGGWAEVKRKDRSITKIAKVNLSDYSTGKQLWATKAAVMINKVAKCSALRDSFPSVYAGTYDETELPEEPSKMRVESKAATTVSPKVSKPKPAKVEVEETKIDKETGEVVEQKTEPEVVAITVDKADVQKAFEYALPEVCGKYAGKKLGEIYKTTPDLIAKLAVTVKDGAEEASKMAQVIVKAVEAGIIKH